MNANRGIRGVGGNKDVSSWLRTLAKTGKRDGIKITAYGRRNPHWEITLHGDTIATVGASGSRSSLQQARADVARALRSQQIERSP